MSEVSSLYAHKAIAQAEASLDRHALFALCGLNARAPLNASIMIPEARYVALLEAIAEGDGTAPAFHVRLGASMRCEDLGAVGFAWKSSRTLRDGFERAVRFVGIVARVRTMDIVTGPAVTQIRFRRLSDETRLGARLSNEATLATFTAICREASGRPVKPIGALCTHDFVGDRTAMEDYLGCSLEDRADTHALIFDNAELARPNAVGDDAISRFFDAQLEEMLIRIDAERSLSMRVRSEVVKNLSGGVPRLSDVADAVGMSARTLQRKLADDGEVYQALVDRARRELAERLLRTTDYALAEIAFLTGFAEQSGFTRAFRRWAGETPRSYRLGASDR